jgi:hypothetical protein
MNGSITWDLESEWIDHSSAMSKNVDVYQSELEIVGLEASSELNGFVTTGHLDLTGLLREATFLGTGESCEAPPIPWIESENGRLVFGGRRVWICHSDRTLDYVRKYCVFRLGLR